MTIRIWCGLAVVGIWLATAVASEQALACCPAGPKNKAVVNADQTVILIWDAATKTQHFIRRASFKSDAADFGFLVPSPTEPQLEESGNEAFDSLRKLTEPEIKREVIPHGAKSNEKDAAKDDVKVLQDKLVAGFHAVVLETKSSAALVKWLQEHAYAYSPEVEAWAKPYVEQGWKITALKVAKGKEAKEQKSVTASALRISFKTEQPLFPYREPNTPSYAKALSASDRLLRIYFLAEARYEGKLTKEVPWTGNVAWSGKVKSQDRKKVLDQLKLPETAGPAEWWLTEFEDPWPYKVAPADVTFSRAAGQEEVRRDPIIIYVTAGEAAAAGGLVASTSFLLYLSVALIAVVAVAVVALLYFRLRRSV